MFLIFIFILFSASPLVLGRLFDLLDEGGEDFIVALFSLCFSLPDSFFHSSGAYSLLPSLISLFPFLFISSLFLRRVRLTLCAFVSFPVF